MCFLNCAWSLADDANINDLLWVVLRFSWFLKCFASLQWRAGVNRSGAEREETRRWEALMHKMWTRETNQRKKRTMKERSWCSPLELLQKQITTAMHKYFDTHKQYEQSEERAEQRHASHFNMFDNHRLIQHILQSYCSVYHMKRPPEQCLGTAKEGI